MAIDERMEVVAAGAEMAPAEATAPSRRRPWLPILVAVLAIVALDVAASILVPPVSAGGGYPNDGIAANIEKVPPHVVFDLQHGDEPAPGALVYFEPTISSTIVTSWIVMTTLLVLAVLATRRLRMIPRGVQNAVEFLYETLANFATSIGGDRGRRYVPLFAGLFIFILFSNWSGLMPFVGKVELLRAPTSDLNITVGLALVSFVVFHVEGVRSLGLRGYLGKFFPLGEFRKGIGAGLIGLFVGVLEFFLEFIKPVTLSMRLFGNIYGGEIALGVVTALLVAILPVALVGLEFLLNFVQALIFSTLTLVFTLIAIEGHGGEEHDAPRGREGEHAIGEAAPA